MVEKTVEQTLVKEVKRRGGLCLKFVSPSLNGVPDRILMFKGGKIAFVETKRPGGKPRPLQVRRIEQLTALGFSCYVVDNLEMISGVIDDVLDKKGEDLHD